MNNDDADENITDTVNPLLNDADKNNIELENEPMVGTVMVGKKKKAKLVLLLGMSTVDVEETMKLKGTNNIFCKISTKTAQ